MGTAGRLSAYLQDEQGAMVEFLSELVQAESPSTVPESQAQVQSLLSEALREMSFEVELLPGRQSGGHLRAYQGRAAAERPQQLLLGHTDTVWPLGTVSEMPVAVRGQRMVGPGVFDMKGGLTQMIFALRALHELGLEPSVAPVIFLNSDEELGSEESTPYIEGLAKEMDRVFVLEPSLGREGKLKTARKGVGQFQVVARGRAAHAGLDPEKGRSAILELSYVIQKLFALNDPAKGINVNVGTVDAGVRANVVAPEGMLKVDVRVPTQKDGDEITSAIRRIRPETDGVTLEISGSVNRRPLERTPRNRALWALAQEQGRALGLTLREGMAGGGSDGNTASQFAATLDGLGAVGDGAHAEHEFLYINRMAERASLLALLLLAPPLDIESEN